MVRLNPIAEEKDNLIPSPKVSDREGHIIPRLEFELTYYGVAVLHISHNITDTTPQH